MARSKGTAVVAKPKGSVGDVTFSKQKSGDFNIVRSKVGQNLSNTSAQQEQREKFQNAVGFAEVEQANPVYIAAAKGKPLTPFNSAVKDALLPPAMRSAIQYGAPQIPFAYTEAIYPPFAAADLVGNVVCFVFANTSPTFSVTEVTFWTGTYNPATFELDSILELTTLTPTLADTALITGDTKTYVMAYVDWDDIVLEANYTAGDPIFISPTFINRPGNSQSYTGDCTEADFDRDTVLRTIGDAIAYLEKHV